jgi:hypothetical protein
MANPRHSTSRRRHWRGGSVGWIPEAHEHRRSCAPTVGRGVRQVWETGTRRGMNLTANTVPFGNVQLARLRPSHIEAWVKEMTNKPLQPSTIRNYVDNAQAVIRAALGAPSRLGWGRRSRNAAFCQTPPIQRPGHRHQRRQLRQPVHPVQAEQQPADAAGAGAEQKDRAVGPSVFPT